MEGARRLIPLALAAVLVAAPGAARADVRRAASVLPPGQSGFVSLSGLAQGEGSPHLKDQMGMFLDFRFKPSTFNQRGAEESPRPGVRIVRDAYGVPAVTGRFEDDVWFGAGYATAQDRLFQLEIYRRATRGRLAEVLGKGYLDMDVQTRRDFYTDGELDFQLAKLPPRLIDRFNAYRDGVNAWIAETRADPSKLPGEFAALGTTPADWDVRDSLAIGVYLARTVPSGDGEELNNARALKALGPRAFSRLLPLRIRGQVTSVPRSEGLFPSQPGRTRRQERKALRRSTAFVQNLSLPKRESEGASIASLGRHGGSNSWAIRGGNGTTTLFAAPQQDFQIPNMLLELELHGPGLDVRGITAAGVPVIGIGHNAHVAWGLTSSLSDDNDLYAEQLVGEEGYRYKGRVLAMDCRDERFDYRSPPTDLLIDPAAPKLPGAGSETARLCRTVHGPVQERAPGLAFARRYAIWMREGETLEGLSGVNEARTLSDVNAAMAETTWGENLVAADDSGNVGYWHPGLFPLRPRGFDERLPYPGAGEAEWRGFLTPRQRPHVIDPKQGYVFNWNTVPSAGWTTGDGPARERLAGAFHRSALLGRAVRRAAHEGGGYERTARVDRITGTTAEQRPLATRRLKRARRGARGRARIVLDTILAWDGSYSRADSNGTVDPGVAAWEAFKSAAKKRVYDRYGKAADLLIHGKNELHEFDIDNAEALALRSLHRGGYRLAAEAAFAALEKRFGSDDPSRWREPRRLYDPGSTGAAGLDAFPFFDRGSFQEIVEFGP
jgi:penicillin G amidase